MVKEGDTFGRLTVVKYSRSISGHHMFICKCSCGNFALLRGTGLLSGHVKSCGCQKIDSARKKKIPEGVGSFNSLYGLYRRMAEKRALTFELSLERFAELTQQNCYYCDRTPSNFHIRTRGNGVYQYNGIDRLDNNKGYEEGNVVTCCKRCNYMKTNMGLSEFLEHLTKIYNNLNLGRYAQDDKSNNIEEL